MKSAAGRGFQHRGRYGTAARPGGHVTGGAHGDGWVIDDGLGETISEAIDAVVDGDLVAALAALRAARSYVEACAEAQLTRWVAVNLGLNQILKAIAGEAEDEVLHRSLLPARGRASTADPSASPVDDGD
jgi:hypothetical protein